MGRKLRCSERGGGHPASQCLKGGNKGVKGGKPSSNKSGYKGGHTGAN
jgi:hypothetical protein